MSLLSPERPTESVLYENLFEEVKRPRLESLSNSPRLNQAVMDYVVAYNLSHSPCHAKNQSPSISPAETRVNCGGKASFLLESNNQSKALAGMITEYHASGRNSKLEKTVKLINSSNLN